MLVFIGKSDHYTHHKFVPFYWRNFVREIQQYWFPAQVDPEKDRVVVNKQKGDFIGTRNIDDYIYRPKEYKDINLYTWIRLERKNQ